MSGHPTPPHVPDGEIVALLDGELGTLAESHRRHLEECDACRERRERFSEYAALVRDELSTIAVPVVDEELFRRRVALRAGTSRGRVSAPVWRRRRWVAGAAIVGLAALAAASPARRWLRSLVETPTVRQPADQPVSSSAEQSSSGGSISFTPTTATFTLRLDSVPATGVLHVEIAGDDKVTASVASGAGTGGDAFVVLPAELRVRNTSRARASYRVALPRSITHFRALIAGTVVFEGSAPASIDLSRR